MTEPAPELAAAIAALLDEYASYVAVRDAAHDALQSAHEPLRAAYRDVIALDPSIAGKLAAVEVQIDGARPTPELLRRAEMAAVHRPASPRSFAWNRTLEREIRDDVIGGLSVPLRRFAQLQRMRARGPLGRRAAPAARQALSIDVVNSGEHVCAICDRDLWTIPGEDLVIEGTHTPVCWICGDEHDAELTAELLAKAVDAAERWISAALPDYIEHWLALLDGLGMAEAVANLEHDCALYQQQVRDAKAAGLGHTETWLASPAA
jgi:hypothetical protein